MSYVIGLDYGTDSVRALIVDTVDGGELSSAVFYYPRWKAGKYCDPSAYQFRQHPLDYLEGLEKVVTLVLSQVPKTVAEQIVGISVDTTGSTPVAVDKNGTPLALLPEFSENPNGMFILWKDHTANLEAEINRRVVLGALVVNVFHSHEALYCIVQTMRHDALIRFKRLDQAGFT